MLLQLSFGLPLFPAPGASVNEQSLEVPGFHVILDVVLPSVAEDLANGAGVATLLLPHKL